MPEPAMCPNCGMSFPDYPTDGKCSGCGTAIRRAAQDQTPKGIDEEIARLTDGETRKVCPTCGKPLPSGARTCPHCEVVEQSAPKRRIPAWVKLFIVLGSAVIGGIVVMVYMQRRGYEKHVGWVERDLEAARQAATAGKTWDAVEALESALDQLQWFDANDPKRETLYGKIEQTRKVLRADVRTKLKGMIERDEVVDAQRFYDTEVKSIDKDGSLRDVIEKALADRSVMRRFQTSLTRAERLHAQGSFPEALKEISELRRQVQDPTKARGEAIRAMRTTVETRQTAWVKESYDKGNQLLNQGRLQEAARWFELGRKYVWSTEVTLRRKLQAVLSHISEKRIVNVVVNISRTRVVKPEAVHSELLQHLMRKLGDEGFLMLTLKKPDAARAGEVERLLTVDYGEKPSREFLSGTGLQKAMGTRITCELRVTSTRSGSVLWRQQLTAETGVIGGVGEGQFNDAALRFNALNTFWRAFDAVQIPGQHLLP